jgi:hypothetical protein
LGYELDMSLSQFIPAGRTSVVNRNGNSLHIQTEYAYRPYPRVTTTILDSGQVLHKVEKKLDKCIQSLEEQLQMEEIIKRQHSEIMVIIKDDKPKKIESTQTQPVKTLTEPTILDELKSVPGVEKVYYLDKEGAFNNEVDAIGFKEYFPALYKGLSDLIEMFMRRPGAEMKRETGLLELEKDRLYFICSGSACVFVITSKKEQKADFEKAFKNIIDPNPLG